MTPTEKKVDLFDLPEFDVPQQEPPAMDRCSYDDAVRAFEEMAEALKLWELPLRKDGKPEEMFEL